MPIRFNQIPSGRSWYETRFDNTLSDLIAAFFLETNSISRSKTSSYYS
jgi:hypothetical protein